MTKRKASTARSDLEQMLVDETAEPRALPLSLLEDITGDFSHTHEIGRGGFAVVYKGILGNRAVAVKRLTNDLMDEMEFHREVECLMRVKHKNVVRFLGYCANRQGTMERYHKKLVMADVHQRLLCFEYVPQGSLDKYIIDAYREWGTCYRIIGGICEGLQYLHENNIIHLDLKPANILLGNNMVPKITDFGLSRCFDENQSRHITKNILGTLGYLAPELRVGGVIARSADLYSLGVIIIEILTGQKGYQDIGDVLDSWSDRLERSQQDTLREQIRVCYEIALECIDFSPKKRPASARNIIDRLHEMRSVQKYKTVDHSWRVLFAQRTVVEPIVPQPINFPKYGYTSYPISQYQSRIKQINLLSDVVGLVTSITGILMPSGGSTDHRRQIHITDGQTPAVVTLWGKLADDLDADRLQRWSTQEPIIILFVAMSVDEFNGNLAFKSTQATRWYINPTIPEAKAILERSTTRSHQIEIRTCSQNRSHAMAATITELSAIHPDRIMGQHYKLEIKITEVVTKDDNWWYMACKQCWRGLKNNRCNCTEPKPAPRYKICLYGIDANAFEEENPTFAEFIFFGQQGNILTGKEADYLLEETRVQNEDTPRELLDLVGKKFIVTVILDDNTMNRNHYCFQVKFTERVTDAGLLAPLPLHNAKHLDPTANSSSSSTLPNEIMQHTFPTTGPPTEPTPGEHQKLLSREHETLGTPPSSQLAQRANTAIVTACPERKQESLIRGI